MDQEGTDRELILKELKKRLSDGCVCFHELSNLENAEDSCLENLAVCEEGMLEEYLETGKLGLDSVVRAVRERKVFPCYFGSALRLEGVEELMEGLRTYMASPAYSHEFGAKVYKIARVNRETG